MEALNRLPSISRRKVVTFTPFSFSRVTWALEIEYKVSQNIGLRRGTRNINSFFVIPSGFAKKTGNDEKVVFLKIASIAWAEFKEARCNHRSKKTDQDTMCYCWMLLLDTRISVFLLFSDLFWHSHLVKPKQTISAWSKMEHIVLWSNHIMSDLWRIDDYMKSFWLVIWSHGKVHCAQHHNRKVTEQSSFFFHCKVFVTRQVSSPLYLPTPMIYPYGRGPIPEAKATVSTCRVGEKNCCRLIAEVY